MFRRQGYNTQPWESPQNHHQYPNSPKLDRRNTSKRPGLDHSRGSNHSNSIRLKRTEHSGDRINLSRDRDLASEQNSGLASDGFNDSYRKVPRRMGSVLHQGRRKNAPDNNRIEAAGSRSGRKVVENLYMLTNNIPQYYDQYPTQATPSDQYEEVYSDRDPRYHHNHQR